MWSKARCEEIYLEEFETRDVFFPRLLFRKQLKRVNDRGAKSWPVIGPAEPDPMTYLIDETVWKQRVLERFVS